MGSKFAQRCGFRRQQSSVLKVRLADGTQVDSSYVVRVPVKFGQLTVSLLFHLLDTHIDAVLGMSWLRQCNPSIDWAAGRVSVSRAGRTYDIPAIFHAQLSHVLREAQDLFQTVGDSPPADECSPPADEVAGSTPADISIVPLSTFASEARRGQYGSMFCACMYSLSDGAELAGAELGERQDSAVSGESCRDQGSVSIADALLTEMQQQFPSVFASPTYPITGRAIEHAIHLREGQEPPKRRLYPLASDELQELKRQITEFLDSGRIVPSSSPYGAPILFAKKKDGGLRMCIDYRGLNAQTIPDSFPLPRIDELLSRLQGARCFSKLDLRDGYHQIAVRETDQHKTAFNCRYGSFEWKVMPFGLRNAPSTFQRLMHVVFHDLLDECVVVYLDDILIYSQDVETHKRHVQKVFSRLQKHNLHVKASKCQLLADRLEFLGHVVSSEGVSVDPSKIQAVVAWPVPTEVRHIQMFLGLCNYYRRFVRDFGRIARPLTALTRKGVPFVWDTACQQAFDTLRQALVSAPVLRLFNPTLKTRVVCDASDFAVGATLEQYDECSQAWFPVEFLSKAFSPAELNYSATDREFVGLVLSLKQWRHYLVGIDFVIQTDHASLRYLQTQAKLSRRQARWLELFADFTFQIEHLSGKLNRADPLSRRPDLDFRVMADMSDDLLSTLRDAQAAETAQWFVDIRARAQRAESPYLVYDGLICRVRPGGRTIVVPDVAELRQRLLRDHHEPPLAGHLGAYRVIGSLSSRYYWPGLARDVRSFVRGCQTCQAAKVPTQAPQGLLRPLPIPERPWQSVTMDLVTDLPTTSRGFDAIVTFVDRFSKMVHFRPCKTRCSAADIAQLFMETVVCRHGMPSSVISDRDPRFVSMFWQSLMTMLDCRQSLSTAYHPQTDGQSERLHRSVEQVLRCYCAPLQTNWDTYLPFAEYALNSTPSTATRETPFRVVYGRDPVLPTDQAVSRVTDCKVEGTREFVQTMADTVSTVRTQLQRAANAMARSANRRRKDHDIRVGDLVWVSTANLRMPTRISRKLAPKFVGPYRVLRSVGDSGVAFQVELPDTRSSHDVFHVSLLKKHVAASTSQQQQAPPPVLIDDSLEYVVEDLLDHRVVRRGRGSRREFLVKWQGYSFWDSTWEPQSNLTHCPDILSAYVSRRGIEP